MILLASGSIAGLVVAAVFYANGKRIDHWQCVNKALLDPNTDSQWKILGMVVSSIMLLTVLVTFCIFLYCYKQGRIVGATNPNDPFKPQPLDNNEYGRNYGREPDPMPYPAPYYQPGIGNSSYPNNHISPIPHADETIPVHDKLMNTEQTYAPLRPRDLQRGVWPSNNAYGGYPSRPTIPPKSFSRPVQASPTQFDSQNVWRKNAPFPAPGAATTNGAPIPRMLPPQQQPAQPTTTRIEYIEEDEYDRARRARRALDQPRHEIIEEIIERPRPDAMRKAIPVGKLGKDRSRYDGVTVKPITIIDKADPVDEEFKTDHFYQ